MKTLQGYNLDELGLWIVCTLLLSQRSSCLYLLEFIVQILANLSLSTVQKAWSQVDQFTHAISKLQTGSLQKIRETGDGETETVKKKKKKR